MPLIDHLQSLILDLPPSCVEFCPHNERYAVVGTYNLEKEEPVQELSNQKSQQRNGSLILLQIEIDGLKIIQTLSTPSAILDVHFAPTNISSSVFGVATSTGSIDLYQLQHESQSFLHPVIKPIRSLQYFPKDVLVTAFSWHPDGRTVGMSLSSGTVCLSSIDPFSQNDPKDSHVDLMVHEQEAWTLAFTPDGCGVFSGGDDSTLRFTSIDVDQLIYRDASKESNTHTTTMPWVERRIHGAGVTAILPLRTDDNGSLVLTGSYDEHIRLLHIPPIGRRTVVAEANIGNGDGGVWRLKCLRVAQIGSTSTDIADSEIILLASCMRAGARIVKLHQAVDGQWQFEVLAKFEEHKSMNYGSDSQSALNSRGQHTIITTSFYDRLLCLWRY